MIKFCCPHCGQKLGVPDDYAGRRARCTKCNQPITVPAAPSAAPAAPVLQGALQGDAMGDPPCAPEAYEMAGASVDQNAAAEDPRQAAIRLARQQRAKTAASAAKGRHSDKSPPRPHSDKPRIGLADRVPEALRLPVGLLLAVVCMAVVIAGWVLGARACLRPLCIVALFVPLAAAFGLKLVTVNPTFLLGVLGTLIGTLGIAAGKAAIAQYVVIPFQRNYADAEVLTDMPRLMADEAYQLQPGQSAGFVARDGDFMKCVALISLVDEGKADPVAARRWAFDILRASNKTNIYAMLTAAIDAGPEVPRLPEVGSDDQPMFDLAYQRLAEWEESETELDHARKYFPALNRIASQCETDRLLSKPDTAFKFALLATLGLLDALWILLGMGLAYISITLD